MTSCSPKYSVIPERFLSHCRELPAPCRPDTALEVNGKSLSDLKGLDREPYGLHKAGNTIKST